MTGSALGARDCVVARCLSLVSLGCISAALSWIDCIASVCPSRTMLYSTPVRREHSRQHSSLPTAEKVLVAVLAMYALQARHLPSSSRQPRSDRATRPGQLRRRKELMHQLMERLPSDQHPRKHGGAHPPAGSLAKSHYSLHSSEEGHCKVCNDRPANRKQTRFICAACSVHLCVGECFATYHGKM